MDMLKGFFDHWDKVHGITLRLIKQIPEDKLDLRPTEKNFTMRDLVTHIYHAERVFTRTGVRGEIKLEDFQIIPHPHLETVEDLYNYAKEVHDETNNTFSNFTIEQIMRPVKTPWGEMPLFHHINSAYEHHLHHRGQLYIYLRLAGVENPVFVYDYANNE